MAKFPPFQDLWAAFPKGEAVEVKAQIGGRVDADWITNTCAIRVSRALNNAGATISYAKGKTISGADGKWHYFRVADLGAYLLANFGKPDLVIDRKAGAPALAPKDLLGVKGIVKFDVRIWRDATGHFTLWDGATCADKCYFAEASSISLWKVR